MLCYVMLCYAMFCSVMLCCVKLYYVILGYVMLCYGVSQFHDLEKMTICFENFKAQKTFLFYFESNYNNIVIVPITHLYWKCYPSSVSASLCYVMLCYVVL